MSSSREHSFDPNAGATDSRPARPFNWVQWIGAALIVGGILVMLSVIAGRIGLVAGTKDMLSTGTALCILGTVLVNSRRESVETTPAGKRRRLIIVSVTLAVCAVVLGVLFYFKGA